MKRIILFLPIIFLSAALLAQTDEASKPQRTPEQVAEKQTMMLKHDLALTDQQVEQVYAVNLKYAQLGRPQNQQQAEERIKQKLTDLKVILSEQQYNLFVEKMSEFRRQRAGMKLKPMPVDSDTMVLRTSHKADGYHN